MIFENLLLQIVNEFHKSIQKFKQQIVCDDSYNGLTLSHLYYIEAIYQLVQPTVSELASHLNVSKASASEAIKKLNQRNLLIKSQSGHDKRVFHVTLSDQAMKLIEAEKKAMDAFIDNIKNTLNSDEIRVLEEIFTKILKVTPDNMID
jgi:DNA-binding MarR family transcriptional regulator